ncbi:transcriptional regulator, PadR-like family [[Leptolyngbya] sp. PCC 7376]|uniref:PadR family transcriptional regulator n=1 Tax=[Leptolyngbya] sp. PCC 7376 TaxID=111781 RepID=UPI00029F13D4|nr:PadR family transcriptional regulator [[Leptolyngbya] sp. PCC 7376]AFY40355.1 transcriptional regulator, PadR-like family [[Leptolyngbya] sp. PCC 7376]
MALVHTILTLLLENPSSGYDISKRFEDGISCYWNASQQQIYRELTKMDKAGLVERKVVLQQGKPDKKIYSITEEGHQKVLDWCLQPTEPTVIREDLMVRILLTPHVPKERTLVELQRRRQLHIEQLACYTESKNFYLEQGYFFEEEPTKLDKYRYLTLLRGIRFEESWVAWCNEVLEILQAETD